MVMHRVRMIGSALALGVLLATAALAQSPLDAKASLRDNLTALVAAKKPVTVVLQNGQSYRARIAAVGDQVVVLTEPAQKEFFDVLVPLDQIAAVEVRARD